MHYLLSGLCPGLDEQGLPTVDTQALYDRMDAVRACGLRPMIITYGVPGPLSVSGQADSGPIKDFRLWEAFNYRIAQALIDRYGREEVRKWRFEVWNEPETGQTGYRTGVPGQGFGANYTELYDWTVVSRPAA